MLLTRNGAVCMLTRVDGLPFFGRFFSRLAFVSCLLAPILPWANTADLGLTLTDSPDPVVAGGNLTFTFVITNKGPDEATGVMLTNPLPPSVILQLVTV